MKTLILTALVYGLCCSCEAATASIYPKVNGKGTSVSVLVLIAQPAQAQRINHDYCDSMFDLLFLEEVPETIHLECRNRFTKHTNKMKAVMRANTHLSQTIPETNHWLGN